MSASSHFDPGGPAVSGGIYGLPHTPDEARVILVPVPWEPTTSYRRGTAGGPAAILRASWQLDVFDVQTGRPYEAGIAMLTEDPEIVGWNTEACAAAAPVIAAGGVTSGDLTTGSRPDAVLASQLRRVNVLSRRVNQRVEAIVRGHLARGKLVGTVGGDHSSVFGAIAAHAAVYPGLGILHIDAHADLRDAYEGFEDSHASIMFNVMTRLPAVAKLMQVGLRDLSEDEIGVVRGSGGRIVAFTDADLSARLFEGEPFHRIADAIVAELPREVYISFDIDGLDPSQCPHTGTPVPGGLSFQQAVALIARVQRSGRRIVGFDLNEVAPGPEGDDWDGNVGARMLYKLIGFSLLSQVG